MNAKSAVNQYRQTDVHGNVINATPHQLIEMLLKGALDKIHTARGSIAHGDIAGKGENISWALSIIGGLRGSLDMEKGGEIAENLDNLYEYMERQLFEANVKNDAEILEEVASLLSTILNGWMGISPGKQSMTTSENQSQPRLQVGV